MEDLFGGGYFSDEDEEEKKPEPAKPAAAVKPDADAAYRQLSGHTAAVSAPAPKPSAPQKKAGPKQQKKK